MEDVFCTGGFPLILRNYIYRVIFLFFIYILCMNALCACIREVWLQRIKVRIHVNSPSGLN